MRLRAIDPCVSVRLDERHELIVPAARIGPGGVLEARFEVWNGADRPLCLKQFNPAGSQQAVFAKMVVERVPGLTVEKVVGAILIMNDRLPDEIGRRDAETGRATLASRKEFPYTDLGNAERFISQHGDNLRYSFTLCRYLVWDRARWKVDETGQVERWAKATARNCYAEAARIEDDHKRGEALANAQSLESAAKIRAMMELGRSEAGIPVRPADMDRDSWLLTTANGTVELRTGTIREHRREDLVTKLAPVAWDPGANCPLWLAFLGRIFDRSEQLIAFIRRAIGYSLTGKTTERCVFILYGAGSNGKTTLLKVVMTLLGDYALRTPTQTLMAKRGESIPNDVARLKGARFITASETEENARLAEATIKDLAGNDVISARFMRGEWFDFALEGKIWLATNHKPLIRGTDRAIWDRIRLIPFNVRIEDSEKDPNLFDKLCAELPGILRWAVEGCLEWQRDGLGVPEEVAEATETYRAEMDSLAGFIAECCTVQHSAQAGASDLYRVYRAWTEANGDRAMSQRAFGLQLGERGFTGGGRTTGGRKVWRGIGLVNQVNHSELDSGINAKNLSHGDLSEKLVNYGSLRSLDNGIGCVICGENPVTMREGAYLCAEHENSELDELPF